MKLVEVSPSIISCAPVIETSAVSVVGSVVPGFVSSTIVLSTLSAVELAAMFSKLVSVIVPTEIVKPSLPSANASSIVGTTKLTEF